MSDIFISYARADRARARMLADSLEAEGWSVWWDQRIRSGEAFDRVIESALANAKCVIALWSRHSVGSDWVRAEAANGLSRGILISALIDEGAALPLRFSQIQTQQLSGWNGPGTSPELQALMADISVVLGLPRGITKKESPSGSEVLAKRHIEADAALTHRARDQEKPDGVQAHPAQEPWWRTRRALQWITGTQLAAVIAALLPVAAFAPGGKPTNTDLEEFGYVLVWICWSLTLITGVWFVALKRQGRLRMSFVKAWVLPAVGLGMESLAMIFNFETGRIPMLGALAWTLAVGCLAVGAFTVLQEFRKPKAP